MAPGFKWEIRPLKRDQASLKPHDPLQYSKSEGRSEKNFKIPRMAGEFRKPGAQMAQIWWKFDLLALQGK